MGLGAARKRVKLSHDPNNTAWTRTTTKFGHQQLLAQGWTPGTNLGVSDTPYAQFQTDGSASHIRVSQTEDNLGLGATPGSLAQYTGLDVFQNLLGRLNGKSEIDLGKEQKARDNLKATIYAERKNGGLRFVSGGFLVGSRQEQVEEVRLPEAAVTPSQGLLALPSLITGDGEIKQVLSYRQGGSPPCEASTQLPVTEAREETHHDSVAAASSKSQRKAEKARRKLDRRKRREAKRLRHEARQAKRKEHRPETPSKSPATPRKAPTSEKVRSKDQRPPSSLTSHVAQEPKVSQDSRTTMQGGRLAVRHRHIQQKRMACMDPKALNEVSVVPPLP